MPSRHGPSMTPIPSRLVPTTLATARLTNPRRSRVAISHLYCPHCGNVGFPRCRTKVVSPPARGALYSFLLHVGRIYSGGKPPNVSGPLKSAHSDEGRNLVTSDDAEPIRQWLSVTPGTQIIEENVQTAPIVGERIIC